MEKSETPLARATREPRKVQLVLNLHFNPSGSLVRVVGLCAGRQVLDSRTSELGDAALRTLELGALGALLGR